MQQQKFKTQGVRFQEGSLKFVTEEAPQLQNNEVLIKVAYSPVTNFDKACLNISKEGLAIKGKEKQTLFCGSEGSGTIE